jgi:cytokinin dehydrogenase
VRAWLAGLDEIVLTGWCRYDAEALTNAGRDFGGMVERGPAAVLVPGDVLDVAQVMNFAKEMGISVAARGRAHSTGGQSLVHQGIVIDMTALDAVHSVADDFAVVDAGASWRAVLAASLPAGRTPPVLPDFLDLSVGGTLSLGGLGGTSHRYGAMVDNVIELEVVTGGGDVVTCSAATNADLFRAVLAGLGQCGVITRATVRLVPAPAHVQHTKTLYETTAELNRAQLASTAEGRHDYVEGLVMQDGAGGWLRCLETATYLTGDLRPEEPGVHGDGVILESLTVPYFDFANRLGDEDTFLTSLGHHRQPRPWCSVLVPESAIDGLLDAGLSRPVSELGDKGMFLIYPVSRARMAMPLLRTPHSDIMFQFSVFRYAEPGSPQVVESMLKASDDMYTTALDAGGTLYPFASVAMGPDRWRAHWGEQWNLLSEAKAKYDPRGILGAGQGIFAPH